jgi:ketosteroid isomerase-like protein
MMHSEILNVEEAFEHALVRADGDALERVLAPDFVLIDLRGTIVSRTALLESVSSGSLRFQSIIPSDLVLRAWGTAAVVIGRTEMKVTAAGVDYVFQSRFTHVFVEQGGEWRMASAQGTPIAD